MQNQAKAYLCGLAAVLLWSTVTTAFKLSLRRLDHIQLLRYASVVSGHPRSGRITVKVVPAPTSLAASMRPPWSSMICR